MFAEIWCGRSLDNRTPCSPAAAFSTHFSPILLGPFPNRPHFRVIPFLGINRARDAAEDVTIHDGPGYFEKDREQTLARVCGIDIAVPDGQDGLHHKIKGRNVPIEVAKFIHFKFTDPRDFVEAGCPPGIVVGIVSSSICIDHVLHEGCSGE